MSAVESNLANFILASVITSYPDPGYKEAVNGLLADESIVLPTELRELLCKQCSDEEMLNDLRSEYISVFDQSKLPSPLYETEYGRERAMFKAHELSDIAGFYKAFGFDLNQDTGREMIDHVSVELEFYGLLMMKLMHLEEEGAQDGVAIVADGMKKFMTSHLGRFVSAIAEREGVRGSQFYGQVFNWAQKVVSDECVRIGAEPEHLGWFDTHIKDENLSCGGFAK